MRSRCSMSSTRGYPGRSRDCKSFLFSGWKNSRSAAAHCRCTRSTTTGRSTTHAKFHRRTKSQTLDKLQLHLRCESMTASRTCPLDYRCDASIFREHASMATDTLYVVGGLYGNEPALDEVVTMFERERGTKHLVFNGDFNWFNIAPERFRRVNEWVLAYDAVRGNVETELARTTGNAKAGCGCGYPDFVDDG